jgi:hypothetical protein
MGSIKRQKWGEFRKQNGNVAYSQQEAVAESTLRCVGSEKGEATACEGSLMAAGRGGCAQGRCHELGKQGAF